MKLRSLATLVAAVACLAWAGSALARNPHCAGGIQYVVQGLKDKDRGNTEDYEREMRKAVEQLTMCASEDPADFEALGYLGWALAEVDSAGPAGDAFEKAIEAARVKGDKKKVEVILSNRDHYWSIAYNDGIKNIQDGQQYVEAEAKAEAHEAFGKAVTALMKAKLLRPGHAQTIRNLATAYAMDNDFDRAEIVLRNGQAEAAQDTTVGQLGEALRTVRANKANALLGENKFDEAVAYYTELTKQEAGTSDLWMGLGNAFFKRATIVCHARELEAASAPDAVKAGFVDADWKHPNRFDTFDGQKDLFGDGRIVALPLPGHTPGMSGALVQLERSGRYLLASDAVALRANFEREQNPKQTWNQDMALASLKEIQRIEAGGATVIFGHDLEQWESLKKGAQSYD